MSTQIRIAETEAEKEAIYKFRYSIYVDELGKHLKYANHTEKRLCDDTDYSATHFFVKHESEIIASLRIHLGQQVESDSHQNQLIERFSLHQFAPYEFSHFSFTSRLMISSKWRNQNILGKLLLDGYRYLRTHGVLFDFCHARPALVPIYEHLGYLRYKRNIIDESGYQIPLTLITNNVDYFKSIRSIFSIPAKKFSNSTTHNQWFSSTFNTSSRVMASAFANAEDFWSYLISRLNFTEIHLFDGLSEEESQKFIQIGNIIQCKEGEKIVQKGEVGDELFLVLEGLVEVVGKLDHKQFTIANFEKGELFGEMAFISNTPRSADIVAVSDLELLVFSRNHLEKSLKTHPAIIARVLLNIARVLSERLRISTHNWLASESKHIRDQQ